MDDADTDALMDNIRAVCASRPKLAMMIIEHDMRLVAALPPTFIKTSGGYKVIDGFRSIRRLC
jgi:branched-chain amino acid transport system ATP-binding protein